MARVPPQPSGRHPGKMGLWELTDSQEQVTMLDCSKSHLNVALTAFAGFTASRVLIRP